MKMYAYLMMGLGVCGGMYGVFPEGEVRAKLKSLGTFGRRTKGEIESKFPWFLPLDEQEVRDSRLEFGVGVGVGGLEGVPYTLYDGPNYQFWAYHRATGWVLSVPLTKVAQCAIELLESGL